MSEPRTSFDAYYEGYRAKHRNPLNRGLHLLAKLLALGALVVAAVLPSVWALLAAPVLLVLPCWIGHLLFEGNRPASWDEPSASLLGSVARGVTPGKSGAAVGKPYYSFLADLRMCGEMLGISAAGAEAPSERT